MLTEMRKQLLKEDLYLQLLFILLATGSSLESIWIDYIVNSYCTLESAIWPSKMQSKHKFLNQIVVCCFTVILKYDWATKTFLLNFERCS